MADVADAVQHPNPEPPAAPNAAPGEPVVEQPQPVGQVAVAPATNQQELEVIIILFPEQSCFTLPFLFFLLGIMRCVVMIDLCCRLCDFVFVLIISNVI